MESVANAAERRLLLVVEAVVFVDTMFYAAIAPLLPSLAHELHLSKLSAGVMTAGYPAGTLAGAIPGGVLAARAGPRRTVYVGLGLLALSTLAFGLADNVLVLDAARFAEGVGGAFSWAGGLAWIIAQSSPARRGALIGRALAAAIGGALLGPVIGTVAVVIGRAPAFSAVSLISLVLMLAVRRLPVTHAASGQGLRQLGRAFHASALPVGMWLVGLPAVASGLINVLGPLRLHRLGMATVAIGAVYLAAAATEAPVGPFIGRFSDRRGRLVPVRFGLAAAACLLALFAVPQMAWMLALLIVATAGTLGAFWTPAMALLSDIAENRGLDQGLAVALVNLAWAGGQIIGAGGGGALAKSTGDAVPTVLTAGLCVLTLAAISGATVLGLPAPRLSRRR